RRALPGRVNDLQEAVTCSRCLVYFNHPVILKCGHNFCRSCITRHCKDSKVFPPYPCPQCREPFQEGEFQPNRDLRNVVEITKKIPDLQGKKACEKHEELLKLFCEVDQTPICVVCRESRSHKDHSVIPLDEAAVDYQVMFAFGGIPARAHSRHQPSKLLLGVADSKGRHCLQSFFFFALCHFGHPAGFFLFLFGCCSSRPVGGGGMEEGSALQQARQGSPRPSLPADRTGEILEAGGCLVHSPAGAGSVTDTIRPCPRAELCPSRSDSLSAANVTLDPDTAYPYLIMSADRKSVRRGNARQAVPNNPERFDCWPCVLGFEGFTSGRHTWEVEAEVDGRGDWAVGVARESVRRKGWISFTPEWGIWAVRCSEDRYWDLTSPVQRILLSPSRAPRRIRVHLDYEQGQVMFVDAGTGDVIVTFPPASFAGERIRPFFCAVIGSVRLL
uniref:Uncharacterized protein n=1 Tax=Chrysemys picta bellii TaxID=8478 RepID=A0A8C3HMW3_CHRPI